VFGTTIEAYRTLARHNIKRMENDLSV